MSADRPLSTRTRFQDAQLRFTGAVVAAREELTPAEWDVLLDVLVVLIARLQAERLWREERRP
jgi:hypothetical protein